MILAIGYRVRSPRGTQFRQWATGHLAEYLVKGFVMDDERLKNPGGWDYFDELLARTGVAPQLEDSLGPDAGTLLEAPSLQGFTDEPLGHQGLLLTASHPGRVVEFHYGDQEAEVAGA